MNIDDDQPPELIDGDQPPALVEAGTILDDGADEKAVKVPITIVTGELKCYVLAYSTY